jgi:16S rRNA (uracil1498-N3)-methyltransferase
LIRIFAESRSIAGGKITLQGKPLHYLRNVLRAQKGAEIIVFDGGGNEYLSRIDELNAKCSLLSIIDSCRADNESPADITLALGVSKPKSFEFSIQKTTELGVKKFIPLVTERSIPVFNRRRAERTRKIIIEAARQCGRSSFPELEEPLKFPRLIEAAADYGFSILPWEEEEYINLGRTLEKERNKKVLVIIGPEGGFSRHEADAAREAGVCPVSLGPRILRAETAAAAVCAIIMYKFELRD